MDYHKKMSYSKGSYINSFSSDYQPGSIVVAEEVPSVTITGDNTRTPTILVCELISCHKTHATPLFPGLLRFMSTAKVLDVLQVEPKSAHLYPKDQTTLLDEATWGFYAAIRKEAA